ncbi:MAG TPA: CHAD domain-containing protein, partial [bacterium]|nr:CHAD domain-containing protein [bacterium]
ITLDDTMAEAARKTLWRHWKRAREAEPRARDGGDTEGVHDLRVAVRRLRVAFRVFRDYLDREATRPLRRRLGRTARLLGAVRDLDVFHVKTQQYLDILPAGRRTELDALLAVWKAQHTVARAELVAWLDSRKFARFKVELGARLKSETDTGRPAHAPHGDRVRDIVPIVLLSALATVRAHDELVAGAHPPLGKLHRRRIACKRMRYTLEFFARALGAPAERLIGELTAVQDHLGNLQDAVIACGILQDFLASGTWTNGGPLQAPRVLSGAVVPGVAAYLDVRQREIRMLVGTFQDVWAPIRSTGFKRELLALIADW